MVGLPSIESSFVTHAAKGFTGFKHPDWPAVRVASEVLNATESYLWVRLVMSCSERVAYIQTAIHPRFWIGLWCICFCRPGGWMVQLLAVQGKILRT